VIAALGREVLQIGAADLEGVEHETAGLVVRGRASQDPHHLPEGKLQESGLAVGGQRAIQFFDVGNHLVKLAKTLAAPRGRAAARPGQRELDRRVDWALSHPARAGCPQRRIMVEVVPTRWLVQLPSGDS